MVKLPLLIGARPRFLLSNKGPLIPLGSGDWLITSNHKDSQIFIDFMLDNKPVSRHLNGSPVIIRVLKDERLIVQACITQAGTENYLDIFAEKQ